MFKKAITLILMFLVGFQHVSLHGATASKEAAGAIDKSSCTARPAKESVPKVVKTLSDSFKNRFKTISQDVRDTVSGILELEDANGRFLEDTIGNAKLLSSVKSLNSKSAKHFYELDKALQGVGTQTSDDEQILKALQKLLGWLFSFDVAIDVVNKRQEEIGPRFVRPFQAPLARLSFVLLKGANTAILKELKNEFLSVGTAVIIADVNAMVTGQENKCSLLRAEAIEQIFAALIFITNEGGFADTSKKVSLADHRGLLDIARVEEETCDHKVVDIDESVAKLEQAAKQSDGSGLWSYVWQTLKWGGLGAGIIGGGVGLYKVNKRINELQELGDQGVTLLGEVDQEGFNTDRRDRLEKLAQDNRVPNNLRPVIIRLSRASEALSDGVSLKECEEKAKYFKEHPYRMVTSEVLNWGKSWIPSRPGWLGGASDEQEDEGDDGENSDTEEDSDDDDEFEDADFVPEDEIVTDDEED